MAHEDENPPPGYNGATTIRSGKSWGAKDSLRRSLNKDVAVGGEGSPLLGSGSGSVVDDDGEDNNENRDVPEPEWEGLADFAGLPWWRKPSVSTCSVYHQSNDH